jgi:hypothetical protein
LTVFLFFEAPCGWAVKVPINFLKKRKRVIVIDVYCHLMKFLISIVTTRRIVRGGGKGYEQIN